MLEVLVFCNASISNSCPDRLQPTKIDILDRSLWAVRLAQPACRWFSDSSEKMVAPLFVPVS